MTEKEHTAETEHGYEANGYDQGRCDYEPIAIVGIGCRFPGAHGPVDYWKMLQEGKPQFQPMPKEKEKKRWNNDAIYNPDPLAAGKVLHRSFGLIDEIDRFDADFFRLSPKEAANMDPQQRILLETTYEALEDAGWTVRKLLSPNKNVGVYVGAYEAGWSIMQSMDESKIGNFTPQSIPLYMLSNRLSHWFGLEGPSMTIDTACSSSLTAVHLAVRAIQQGDCRVALACGSNLLVHPFYSFGLSRAGALSTDHVLRAFDAKANGFLRGEGVGTVVLKPASQAIADGDRIYACVRGSDVYSGGKTKILTQPNSLAEAETMKRAMRRAKVNPHDVRFVEAHGTGTPVGDGIELSAILDAYDVEKRPLDRPGLRIGSVKSLIGHLETASGVASIIKMCLCLHYGQFTPNASFDEPNEVLNGKPITVQTVTHTIENHSAGTLVGVNSFGIGGTLGHVILEAKDTFTAWEAQAKNLPDNQKSGWTLGNGESNQGKLLFFPFSASSKSNLKKLLSSWKAWVESGKGVNNCNNIDASVVAYSLSNNRNHLPFRALVRATSSKMLCAEIANSMEELDSLPKTAIQLGAPKSNALFVFPGQGPQCIWMGKQLFRDFQVFRASVRRVDDEFKVLTGESLIAQLKLFERDEPDPENPEILQDPSFCQSAIFMIQVGLVELLEANGIVPEACIGHSAGEVAAAWASGLLTLHEAVTVAVARAKTVAHLQGSGGMLVVSASEATTIDLIGSISKDESWFCEIAALNSESSTALSGNRHSLDLLKNATESIGVSSVLMRTETPYHCSRIEAHKSVMMDSLAGIDPRHGCERPVRTMYSGSLGSKFDVSSEKCDRYFWWNNTRNHVKFHSALQDAFQESSSDEGVTIDYVVEIANHPVLVEAVLDVFHEVNPSGKTSPVVVNPMHRKKPETTSFLRALVKCFELGSDLTWTELQSVSPPSVSLAGLNLPLCQWDHDVSHWKESKKSEEQRCGIVNRSSGQSSIVNVGGPMSVSLEVDTFLKDHVVNTDIIFPGAGYLVSAIRSIDTAQSVAILRGVAFENPLILSTEWPAALLMKWPVSIGGNNSEFKFSSADGSTSYCSGAVDLMPHSSVALRFRDSSPPIFQHDNAPVYSKEEIYSSLKARGLHYGPEFQKILRASSSGGRCVGMIKGRPAKSSRFEISALDCCFQLCILTARDDGEAYIPLRIGEVVFIREPLVDSDLVVEARAQGQNEAGKLTFNIRVWDGNGTLCAVIEDFSVSQLGSVSNEALGTCFYETAYQPISVSGTEWDAIRQTLSKITAPTARSGNLDRIASKMVRDEPPSSNNSAAWSRYFGMRRRILVENRPSSQTGESASDEALRQFHERAQTISENFSTKSPTQCDKVVMESLLDVIEPLLNGNQRKVVKVALVVPHSDVGLVEAFIDAVRVETIRDNVMEIVLVFVDGEPPVLTEEVRASYHEGPITSRSIAVSSRNTDLGFWGCDFSSFHAILSVDLHRCANISFGRLLGSRVLVPDGIFASVETTTVHAPGYLTTASRESWWLFEDDRETSWLDSDAWRENLGEGFEHVSTVRVHEDEFSSRSLFVAKKARSDGTPLRRAYFVNMDDSDLFDETITALVKACQHRRVETVAVAHATDCDAAISEAAQDERALFVLVALSGFEKCHTSDAVWNIMQPLQLIVGSEGAGTCSSVVLLGSNHPNVDSVIGLCRGLHCERNANLMCVSVPALNEDSFTFADIPIDQIAEVMERCDGSTPEVIWNGNYWCEPKLVRCEPKTIVPAETHQGENFHLEYPKDGSSVKDAYFGTQHRLPAIGESHIRIRVHAAGLNFKIAMVLTGVLPGYDLENCCGDVAGVVESVGVDAAKGGIRAGDRVIAMVESSGITTVLDAHVQGVFPLPDGMTYEEAVTVPICFCTAYNGLVNMARLREGEIVLVQSAAGGVGLAAIQVAQMCGASIIAGVSSEKKKEALRSYGITNFVQSRSLGFEKEVKLLTNGKGVDVVLNSLSGEALKAGIRCLGFGGRFVEIGKADILSDGRMPLAGFEKNLQFLSCHTDSLIYQHKDKLHEVFHDVLRCFENGLLRPLPHTVHPISDVLNQVQRMMLGRHIGKIVLSVRSSMEVHKHPVTCRPSINRRLRSDGTYLITGGLGSVGLALALTMVEHGAIRVVLVGRRPPSSFWQEDTIARMRKMGADVLIENADVGDYNAVKDIVTRYHHSELSLRGIVSVAGVTDDGPFHEMTHSRVQKVMRPKVDGAWNLHYATKKIGADLDFFLMTSSLTAATGNFSQTNYVAANQFLSGLMRTRTSQGLPASVIDLGPVAGEYGGGMIRDSELIQTLSSRGFFTLSVKDAVWGHFEMMSPPNCQRHLVFASVEWLVTSGSPASTRRLTHLISNGIGDLRGNVSQVDLVEQKERARIEIINELSSILQISTDNIDPEMPISNYGLDSLGSVQLITFLKKTLSIMATQFDILGTATTNSLLERMPLACSIKKVRVDRTQDEPDMSVRDTRPTTSPAVIPPYQQEHLGEEAHIEKQVLVDHAPTVTLVTGSTGFLGCRLIQQLVLLDSSTTVVCLIRVREEWGHSDPIKEGKARLKESLQRNGCWPLVGWNTENFRVVIGDVADENLRLSNQDLEFCLSNVTTVVHTACTVDWSLSLHEHDSINGAALKNVFQLLVESTHTHRKRPIAFHFVSSTAVSSSLTAENSVIEESFDLPFRDAILGYGKSKWKQEHFLLDQSSNLSRNWIFVYRIPWLLGDYLAQPFTIPTCLVQSAQLVGAMPEVQESLEVYPLAQAAEALAIGALSDPSKFASYLSPATPRNIKVVHLTLTEKVSPAQQRNEFGAAGIEGHRNVVELNVFLAKLRSLVLSSTGRKQLFVKKLTQVLQIGIAARPKGSGSGLWSSQYSTAALNAMAKSPKFNGKLAEVDFGEVSAGPTWLAFVASAMDQMEVELGETPVSSTTTNGASVRKMFEI